MFLLNYVNVVTGKWLYLLMATASLVCIWIRFTKFGRVENLNVWGIKNNSAVANKLHMLQNCCKTVPLISAKLLGLSIIERANLSKQFFRPFEISLSPRILFPTIKPGPGLASMYMYSSLSCSEFYSFKSTTYNIQISDCFRGNVQPPNACTINLFYLFA